MKQTKRILALVIAFVMIFCAACPTAFAKVVSGAIENIYTDATRKPEDYLNGVDKYEFSAEEGASYVLDLLDGILHDANLNMENDKVLNEWYCTVTLKKIDFTSIDSALWTLWNIIHGVTAKDEDCIRNFLNIKVIGIGVTGLIDNVLGAVELGDIPQLNADALTDQNNTTTRVCRNVPVKENTQASSDLTVLKNLVQFLSDNRKVLKKIATSNLDLGLLGNINLGDTIQPFLDDFPAALKNILYGVLIDGEADEAPSGWTYDGGVQQIVDWLLIDGTGETAETGANSVLGANFDAFLPAIKNQPGAASLTAKTIYADRDGDGVAEQCTMNFYQLVNNAISALLGGMVADMLEGVLLNALDIESTEAYPNGDPAILSDVMFSTIVGAIESLCVACGAPAIVYTQEESSYPIPKIHKLLDWFFNGGGLATFIKIDYNGVVIEDNLVSLLHKVIRILPGLFPLLGISVPDGLTYSTTEMAEQYYDENGTHTYWAYQNYSTDPAEIYIPDPENYPDDYAYVSNGNTVNTTDPTAPNYYDPALIEDRYVLSNDQIYGALIKIVLNGFIDGCYFPEWADTIPVVAAYAVASLAAQYLPENNYFDRLDAYHYQSIGESYTGRVKADAEPLPYTEEVKISNAAGTETKSATIPRAAIDIGMSVVAYIIRGWNDFSSILGYTPETDTTFETYVLEFVLWGAVKFMPVLTGKINSSTHRVEAVSGATSTFMTQINNAFAGIDTLNARYPKNASQSNVSNIPGLESGEYLFTLLDNTLFKVIPMSWLPAWVTDYGSKGVVYDWLFDSIVHFDLQKLISILQTNPTGELATNDTLTVLIRLIDRVLGLVVGGNSILPAEGRNVFNVNTSITSLEMLLGGDGSNLATVIERLLYWLNIYLPVLGDTIFPLIFMFTGDTMKDNVYEEGSTLKDPIGNNQVTYEQLSNYVATVKADDNSTLYYGNQYYTTKAKANTVAEAIGIKNYDADEHAVTVDGATKYVVTFPETYETGTYARNAASYIENGKAVMKRENRQLVHYVYVDDDYRTTTSPTWTDTQETDANGNVISHSYNYPNITRATAIYDSAKGYRTGDYGEVTFTDGYRTFSTEDYRASNLYYYNRWDDAVDDAEDHLKDIDDFAQDTLPNAYHDWLMFYIKTKLVEKGKYDKNLDGVVDQNDGNPDVPSSAYPFYKTSGSTNEFNYSYDAYNPLTTGTYSRSWSFSYCAPTNVVIAEALAYANETEDGVRIHDVVFPNNEAQLIVRLALNTLSFDTTQEGCWDALSAANNTTITNFCNSIGLTYDAENHTISSKAFALFSSSMNSSTTFGKYITWSGNDTDGWTSSTADISLQPVVSITLGADGVDKVANKIQDSYVEFATKVYNLTKGLNKNYDNISWRTAKCEDAICSSPNTNTLEFILSLTNDAYYPQGQETGKNKKLNEFGLVVTAYTKSSFDEFQKAYDYGVCLLNQKNAGRNLTQSLVTVAYKAILQAYKNLVPFSGKADWTTLENYIAQANSILEGDLGLGADVDRSVGYTVETLNNLNAATAVAEQFKALNFEAFDSDYQESVDEQAMILYSVIAGLKFPEGLEPMAIINPAYSGEYEIVEGTGYQLTAGGVKYQIITGLAEGQNFVDTFQNSEGLQNIFIATGYTNDGNANKLFIDKADFGYGTGSSINGYVNLIPRFKFYAVLYGDVNGDTRIDGADKTIVDMAVAQGTTETMEKYIQVASDVNFDGTVDGDDIAAINNYYKKTNVNGIDQAGTPSTSWFNATVSD